MCEVNGKKKSCSDAQGGKMSYFPGATCVLEACIMKREISRASDMLSLSDYKLLKWKSPLNHPNMCIWSIGESPEGV